MLVRRPPRTLPRTLRLIRYRFRRMIVRTSTALLRVTIRLDTWIYLAATGLIGFEGLEVLFGTFLMAPEFVPLVLLALALVWAAKHHGRRVGRLTRLYARRHLRAGSGRARRSMSATETRGGGR